MAVFVLDQRHQPLMPCSEKRARLLLGRQRAVVHRRAPFVIRLKDPTRAQSTVQPVALKLDPGSKTTGMALVRVQEGEEGEVHQRGELFGWEIRSYLLEKFGRRCVYCGRGQMAFEIEHVVPKSRGGSDRVSNLVLSCHECNEAKGNRTAAEFGHPQVQAQARTPLKDAAAMNAARFALVATLRQVGLPLDTWSGGRTRWNRDRFGIEKDHCLDALCVGELAGVELPALCILTIHTQGRGSHQRTNVDAVGFPRGYRTRQKRIRGFSTGDLVQAVVPAPLKTAGVRVGRVAVRKSGSFRVGKIDGINAKYLALIQKERLLPLREYIRGHPQAEVGQHANTATTYPAQVAREEPACRDAIYRVLKGEQGAPGTGR